MRLVPVLTTTRRRREIFPWFMYCVLREAFLDRRIYVV